MLRFGCLTVILAACAPSAVVVEDGGTNPLLVNALGDNAQSVDPGEADDPGLADPGQGEEAGTGSAPVDDVLEEEEEVATPASPSVFFPDRIDVEPPAEPEPEPDPVPVLSIVQDRLSFYSIVGLALDRDGDNGMFGMSGGNACEFDPQGGGLAADFDLFDCLDDPSVYDAQSRVLMICPNDEIAFYSAAFGTQRYDIPGLVVADVNDDAFLTIEDTGAVCQLSRRGHDGALASVVLPDELCDGTPKLAVDEFNDVVYIANGNLFVVDAVEYRQIGVDTGDLIAFDPAHETVVTVWEGDVEVLGLSVMGAPLWRMEAGAPVSALAAVGDLGAVFAVEDNDFVAYDGGNGAVWGVGATWDGMFDFSVSGDGTTMITAVGGTIYTYSIHID